MDSGINTRFQSIINDCFRGNKRAFANAIGVSPTVIENVVGKRGGKPSFDVLYAVCANANISAEWLLTGEGEMLRGGNVQVSGSGNAVVGNSHNSTATVNATPTDTSDLRAMVEEQRTIIEGLQGQLQEKDKQIAQLLAIISKK